MFTDTDCSLHPFRPLCRAVRFALAVPAIALLVPLSLLFRPAPSHSAHEPALLSFASGSALKAVCDLPR